MNFINNKYFDVFLSYAARNLFCHKDPKNNLIPDH